MATNYVQTYRRGMGTSYGNTLADTLAQVRQQEALTGRYFTPEERASIVRGALAPYVADYGAGFYRAGQLEQEERRTDIAEQAQKNQQEAAKMQGYLNMGSLGLNAALTAAIAKQAGLWGAPAATSAIAPATPAVVEAAATGTPGVAAPGITSLAGPTAGAVPWGTVGLVGLGALAAGTQVPGLRDYYPPTIRKPLTAASKYGLGVPAAIATGGLSVPGVRHAVGSSLKKLGKKLGF